MAETKTNVLQLTDEQAKLLRELVHKAAWTGDTIVTIAPVIAQLEQLAPAAAASSSSDRGRG